MLEGRAVLEVRVLVLRCMTEMGNCGSMIYEGREWEGQNGV